MQIGPSLTSVPLGVSSEFKPISKESRDAVLSRLGLPETGYGLTISSLEPRKRIDRLLKAWRMLPRRTRDRFPLVIAGAAGWNNSALHEEIERAAAEGWVIPLGFVPEGDCRRSCWARLFLLIRRFTRGLACRRSKRWPVACRWSWLRVPVWSKSRKGRR